MKIKYSKEQIDFVKDNINNSEKHLAYLFNKRFNTNLSESAISGIKCRNKLRSNIKGGNRKFTDEQLKFVQHNVVNTEKDLLRMFNEKFKTNYNIQAMRNLKNRLHIKSGLIGGQFEKGNEPANKGKKWAEFMSEEGQANSRKTCFKKGNLPPNHKPVGSERVNVDGYVEIKVARVL